jgi:hypothetical protein
VSTGVPAAPKLTGVLWMIRPTMTAAIAGSRARAAAGPPPQPACRTRGALDERPNSQPMMIACTRRSALTVVNPARIVARAPLEVSVWSRSSAPKMM